MNQQEEVIDSLSAPLRRLYQAIEQHGPLGAPELRVDLPLNGDGDWKGRPDGMTKEIRTLQAKGLVRQKGTRKGRGPATRIYEATPSDEIVREADKFKRKQSPTRKRDMSGTTARIADYRRMEKEAGLTARAHWIEKRRRVLELGKVFRDLEPMVYWSEKAVPPDELEQVYDELVRVVAHGIRLEAIVDSMRGDKQLREKIKALRAKADSTEFPGEGDVFRAKALELEAKLR
jgi:hypothetical protein